MKRFNRIAALSLALILMLTASACGKTVSDGQGSDIVTDRNTDTKISEQEGSESRTDASDTERNSDIADTAASGTASIPSDEDMFTGNDLKTEYGGESSAKITLSGSEDVIITEEDTYLISGSLKGASLIVEADKSAKIRLVFDGVNIENEGGAAIYIKQADKVFITLAEGSENSLVSMGEFIQIDDNNIDATIFSKEDLTLGGSGLLNIECETGHGIVSKDDLVITGGIYEINAASHGLSGKDSVRISDGEFEIKAGKDGIHSENNDDAALGYVYIESGSFEIDCDGDGIQGSLEVKINGGEFDITAGDRSSVKNNDYSFGGMWGGPWGSSNSSSSEDTVSMKAVKAGKTLTVNGGNFELDSADDALHSNGNVTISNGTFLILTGDDGVHADLAATISGGRIVIEESYEGIEGETIDIMGGEIDITADDDGLNAAGGADSSGFGGFWGGGGRPDAFGGGSDSYIKISGGLMTVDAEGDGIDSNGTLEVSGGETYVNGPTNSGNGALDYQSGATITGGIFIAAGASGMAQNFGSFSTQGSILISCNGTQKITLKTASGDEILSFTPLKSCNSIVISCPELKQGESYIYECGGSSAEFTLTSLIYGSGMGGGMGGPGGGGGGRPGGRW
ncbi:MAG: carbohydrate-binding domain-containing protein [Clostridia bacterium]|nr:carbohydrate-binding domain-containing protein [Clostridia bacterium]